jgi:hypothetical protein
MAQLLSNTRIYGFASTDGQLSVGNVTSYASTSNTTGSLIVTGGAGISGNVYTSGNVVISSGILSSSNTTGSLIVTGGAGISGNVYANSVYTTTTTGAIYTDNLRYASNGTSWALGGGGSSISTYSANVGNGSNTIFNITHNLSKNNIVTTVRENTSGNVVYPSIKITGTNTINLSFVSAPSANFYLVSIMGF